MNVSSSSKPLLGFVGTGVMGHAMAEHLLRAGYALHVTNRNPAKSAAAMGLDVPGLELALHQCERVAARGDADRGTQALFLLFDP